MTRNRTQKRPRKPEAKQLAAALAPWRLEAALGGDSPAFDRAHCELRILAKHFDPADPAAGFGERDWVMLENPGGAAIYHLVEAAAGATNPRQAFRTAQALADFAGERYDANGVLHEPFTPETQVYHWISAVREQLAALSAVRVMAGVAEVEPLEMAHAVLCSWRKTGYCFVFPPADITLLPSRFAGRPAPVLAT